MCCLISLKNISIAPTSFHQAFQAFCITHTVTRLWLMAIGWTDVQVECRYLSTMLPSVAEIGPMLFRSLHVLGTFARFLGDRTG
ncbi:hypothetical protein PGT21_000270 [Puccinia graminis f. sp. tritici]|uniref:Uncharacterized protein n=1 Tax=Puccinia graminis f. sp. tritici TaxID=56615 RepID=A0A5B0QRD4_PUCGR|nr:hypothetical protein PGT21_000270 [Puccinia graminis f. sp. tritici]